MRTNHNRLIYRTINYKTINFDSNYLRKCFVSYERQFEEIIKLKAKRMGKYMVQRQVMFKNDINQQLDVTLAQEDNTLVVLFALQKNQEFVFENVLSEKKITFVFIDEKREVDER